MSDFRRRLAEELAASEEYRNAYAEAYSNERIAAQIRVLREQRGMTQRELGEAIDSNQGRISLYEDKEYGRWRVETLRKIAQSMGGWLRISIEGFGTLATEADSFDIAMLQRPLIENDADFQALLKPMKPEINDPLSETRGKLLEWAESDSEDLTTLAEWLQGVELPGFGEQGLAYQWMLWAAPLESREGRIIWPVIGARLARLLNEQTIDERRQLVRTDYFLENSFLLIAQLASSLDLQEALAGVYDRARKRLLKGGGALQRNVRSALRAAMAQQQVDARWVPIWEFILDGKADPVVPGDDVIAMEGLAKVQVRGDSYWLTLAEGIRAVEIRLSKQAVKGAKPLEIIAHMMTLVDIVFDEVGESTAANKLSDACSRLSKRKPGDTWGQWAVWGFNEAVTVRNWWPLMRENVEPKIVGQIDAFKAAGESPRQGQLATT